MEVIEMSGQKYCRYAPGDSRQEFEHEAVAKAPIWCMWVTSEDKAPRWAEIPTSISKLLEAGFLAGVHAVLGIIKTTDFGLF